MDPVSVCLQGLPGKDGETGAAGPPGPAVSSVLYDGLWLIITFFRLNLCLYRKKNPPDLIFYNCYILQCIFKYVLKFRCWR